MSLESEMKKLNANLERVSIAIEAITAPREQIEIVADDTNGVTTLTAKKVPYTETKVVEPEVKKEKPAKKENRTVPASDTETNPEPVVEAEVDELDADFYDRPDLTAKQVQVFAREKIKEYAEKDPKLKIKIKKKITDLGASMITELDQDGLVGLEKFLSKL